MTCLQQKCFYQARARNNLLGNSRFPVPISHCHVDYSLHFPQLFPLSDQGDNSKKIQFRGLLISLSTLFPDTLMTGMELRDKVMKYVKEQVLALRVAHLGQYQNVLVVRTNSKKYISNYFVKEHLSKLFFLFPDPHFKKKNHRHCVISPHLLDEYAYVLGVGRIIYTIMDVEELGKWMKACLEGYPMFEVLTDEELEANPVVKLLSNATEEEHKIYSSNLMIPCLCDLPGKGGTGLDREWETTDQYYFRSMASVHLLQQICLNFHKDFTLEQVNRSGSFLAHLMVIQQEQPAAVYSFAEHRGCLRKCVSLFENLLSGSLASDI
ncbi:tRNA (guanine-N(7)-)-methyltransferase, partial [Camellia lanceoleosa]